MDDTDRRLIALLRENSRVPVATLAHLLKVSRGTVQNRIDRLTADGVIGGFTVRKSYQPPSAAQSAETSELQLLRDFSRVSAEYFLVHRSLASRAL
jgi:DNA-binding Lrp family transcriptional regulator